MIIIRMVAIKDVCLKVYHRNLFFRQIFDRKFEDYRNIFILIKANFRNIKSV